MSPLPCMGAMEATTCMTNHEESIFRLVLQGCCDVGNMLSVLQGSSRVVTVSTAAEMWHQELLCWCQLDFGPSATE